jgi:N-acetylmuramoyl-L-alanine amidase
MVMEYPVLPSLLREAIQDRVPLTPARLVVHSTDNPGATAEDHFNYLDAEERAGWSHYYLDWDSIRQVVSEGFRAPAQGPTANRDSLSFEMCEPPTDVPQDEQEALFAEVWSRAVALAADILHRYGWGTDRMYSHADISRMYGETNHTDPIGFLARYGRSWSDFVAAVDAELERLNGALPAPHDWQTAFIDQLLQAGIITQRRHPLQPVLWWELAAIALRVKNGP